MITVVMTGGTSGLGRVAAQQIFETPGTRLLLGARTTSKASIETWPLDLVRLASVRAFAQAIEETLGATQIDVLVLNAGTQFANNDGRTEDGFETTFAVNHLAHYLLLRLLLPKLAHGATVVITTSDTHDPRVHSVRPGSSILNCWLTLVRRDGPGSAPDFVRTPPRNWAICSPRVRWQHRAMPRPVSCV